MNDEKDFFLFPLFHQSALAVAFNLFTDRKTREVQDMMMIGFFCSVLWGFWILGIGF